MEKRDFYKGNEELSEKNAITAAPAAVTTEENAPKAKNKKRTVIAAIAIFTALVVLAAAFFIRKPGTKGEYDIPALQQRYSEMVTFYSGGGEEEQLARNYILQDGRQVQYPSTAYLTGIDVSMDSIFYVDVQEAENKDDGSMSLVSGKIGGSKQTVVFEKLDYVFGVSSFGNALLFGKNEGEKETPHITIYSYYQGKVEIVAQKVTDMHANGSLALSALYERENEKMYASGLSLPEWEVAPADEKYVNKIVSQTGKTVYLIEKDTSREAGDHLQPVLITIYTNEGKKHEIAITSEVSDLFGSGSWKYNLHTNANGDQAVVTAEDGIWLYNGDTVEKLAGGSCEFAIGGKPFGTTPLGQYGSIYSYPQEEFSQFYYRAENELFFYEKGKEPFSIGDRYNYIPYCSEDLKYLLCNKESGRQVLFTKNGTDFIAKKIDPFGNFERMNDSGEIFFSSYNDGFYSYYLWKDNAMTVLLEKGMDYQLSADFNSMAYLTNFDKETWRGELYVSEKGKPAELVSDKCGLIYRVHNDGSVYFMTDIDVGESEGRIKKGTLYRYHNGKTEVVEEDAYVFWNYY